MHEERLRNMLNSLSHLADHGDIPVHAFGTLLRAAKTDIITENLHQKWLADQNFSRLAAQIVYHFHSYDNHDVSSLTSSCLAHVLRDYKCRRDIRLQSRMMFRNYTRTLAEFYTVYRHIDLCLAQTLIAPLFSCLDELIDEDPDNEDIKCAAQIVVQHGNLLSEQSVSETTSLVMKCRSALISNSIQKSEETNALLIAVSDLWHAGWHREKLSEVILNFHEDHQCSVNFLTTSPRSLIQCDNRSRSSSGFDSPLRFHPLQIAIGSKRVQDKNHPQILRNAESPKGSVQPDNVEEESIV